MGMDAGCCEIMCEESFFGLQRDWRWDKIREASMEEMEWGKGSDRQEQLNNQQGARMLSSVLRTSVAQEGKVGGRSDGNFDS